jgi:hypothetical protein
VLLLLGAPSKAALAGVGFALIGAALTRAVDVAKEHRAAAAQAEVNRRRDLDETRRLAYMALTVSEIGEPSSELVATLVNALTHHGLAVKPAVARHHIRQVLHADPKSERWLQDKIDRISAELGS